MAPKPAEHRMDERLAALLEVERELEARVQQRDGAARARVDALLERLPEVNTANAPKGSA